jgi:hypothetical protein
MRKITTLMALMTLFLVAGAGIAYAVNLQLGDGKDRFEENNDPQCEDDSVMGGGGKDALYFNTSNESNCPNGDVDVGRGQQGNNDLLDVSDTDTLDDVNGGMGRGDKCIITVDQNGTLDTSDDTQDTAQVGGVETAGCEEVIEVIYNQPQP